MFITNVMVISPCLGHQSLVREDEVGETNNTHQFVLCANHYFVGITGSHKPKANSVLKWFDPEAVLYFHVNLETPYSTLTGFVNKQH
jgi:hypothetical protein